MVRILPTVTSVSIAARELMIAMRAGAMVGKDGIVTPRGVPAETQLTLVNF